MILKIKSEVENSNQSWRFYDKVEGLHYTVYDDAEGFKGENERCGKPVDVQEVWYGYNLRLVASLRPLLFLTFVSDTTGPMHILCETECYLLNDNGKTIERLI